MATSKTIVATLVAAHYVATEAQVETLSHERYVTDTVLKQTDGTYLRIALVHAQSMLGKPRGRGVKPLSLIHI